MLEAKGAVLVEGAKWCGKTTTAEQISNSQLYMQDPAKKAQNLQLANLNPSLLLEGKTPRLIDEWQLAPKLWDAVRFEVDKRNVFNQFILTGSAVPASFDEISHSGTGRIARLLMRPMTLLETGDSTGKVSLQKLFQDDNDIAVTNESDLKRIAYLICRGGWPKVLGVSEKIALRQAVDYYNGVVNSDVSRVDNKERNAERAKRLMYSYSRNIGTQIKYEELRKDVISNDIESFSIETLYDYINALKKNLCNRRCSRLESKPPFKDLNSYHGHAVFR